jgi:hypothetical protein
MQPKTIKIKNNGCGTAPGNLVRPFVTSDCNIDVKIEFIFIKYI